MYLAGFVRLLRTGEGDRPVDFNRVGLTARDLFLGFRRYGM